MAVLPCAWRKILGHQSNLLLFMSLPGLFTVFPSGNKTSHLKISLSRTEGWNAAHELRTAGEASHMNLPSSYTMLWKEKPSRQTLIFVEDMQLGGPTGHTPFQPDKPSASLGTQAGWQPITACWSAPLPGSCPSVSYTLHEAFLLAACACLHLLPGASSPLPS